MFRNQNLSALPGSGGAAEGFMGKVKGMFSRMNATVFIYLFVFLLFMILAYYLYQTYVSPKLSPSYADNSSPSSSGSGGGGSGKGGKEAELILFSTDWCPHCKTAKPHWEEVKAEYNNKMINGYHVIFTEVNCTEESAEVERMMNQYQVEGYPTIKLLKDGQVIEFDAKPTKSSLQQFLNTVL